MKHRLLLLVVVLMYPPPCSADEARYAGKPLAFWMKRLQSDEVLLREEALVVLAEAGPQAREAAPLTYLIGTGHRPHCSYSCTHPNFPSDRPLVPNSSANSIMSPTPTDKCRNPKAYGDFGTTFAHGQDTLQRTIRSMSP
jgi:hypothetical protein